MTIYIWTKNGLGHVVIITYSKYYLTCRLFGKYQWIKIERLTGLLYELNFLKLINAPGYHLRQNEKMIIRNEIYDFVVNSHIEDCSVFEVMIALAQRIERDIMYESRYGDRTKKWFWIMINSLGLENQNDRMFDIDFVEGVLVRFIDRKYHIDGKGSLFYIPDCMYDLRTIDIWGQANKFLIYYDIDKLFD